VADEDKELERLFADDDEDRAQSRVVSIACELPLCWGVALLA
jgi:hypothetical protein